MSNKESFQELINSLALLFGNIKVDKIACVEARGFILGSALAYKFGVGIILLRKEGKLKNKVFSENYRDYTGKEKKIEIYQEAISAREKILITDDWVETGGVLKAVIKLIEKEKGEIVGIGVLMDDSNDEVKKNLIKYNYKYLEKAEKGDNF